MTRPSRLARYGFADSGARAGDLLGPTGLRLWDLEAQEPVDSDAAELIRTLSRAADPNLALRQLHRLVESVARAAARVNGGPVTGPSEAILWEPKPGTGNAAAGAVIEAIYDDTGLRRRLVAVLGASSALGDHLVANPDQWRGVAPRQNRPPPHAPGGLPPRGTIGGRPPGGAGPRPAGPVAPPR